MRISFKTRRYIIDLYDELKTIAPECGVDPKLCLIFAMVGTGFVYNKFQYHSLLSRRVALTMLDQLHGNNIFMLSGKGTAGAQSVIRTIDNVICQLPIFMTRQHCIMSFCAVIRRCLGDELDSYTLTERVLAVWAAGYADNMLVLSAAQSAAVVLAQLLNDESFLLTKLSRCGMIVKKVHKASTARRRKLCRSFIAAGLKDDKQIIVVHPDHIFCMPHTKFYMRHAVLNASARCSNICKDRVDIH